MKEMQVITFSQITLHTQKSKTPHRLPSTPPAKCVTNNGN